MIPGRFPSASGKPLSALIRAALLILASASAGGGGRRADHGGRALLGPVLPEGGRGSQKTPAGNQEPESAVKAHVVFLYGRGIRRRMGGILVPPPRPAPSPEAWYPRAQTVSRKGGPVVR